MKKYIFLICVFLLFTKCQKADTQNYSPKAVNGVLNLENWNIEKDGTVELIGDWEFYWNELIENTEEQKVFFENFDRDKIRYIPVPLEWQTHELNGSKLPEDGYAMYRLKVILPNSNLPLAFFMTDICTAYSLSINQVYHYGKGKVGKTKEETNPLLLYGNFPLKVNAKELEIVILVSNFHHGKAGLWNKITIGNPSQIDSLIHKSNSLRYFTIGALLIMGLYHLILFGLRSKDKSPLYFGICCIILVIRILSMEDRPIMNLFPDVSFLSIYKLEYISFYLAVPFFVLFVQTLFPDEFSKVLLRICLFFFIMGSVIVVFTGPKTYSTWLLLIMQILLLLFIVYSQFVLVLAIVRKRMGAASFLHGTIIFYFAIINDVLYGMNIIHTEHISTYGFLGFIFCQSIVLSIRFSNAFTMSEKLSDELTEKSETLLKTNIYLNVLKEGLETKVEERTKKLEEVYQKNLLEEQKVSKLKAEIYTIQERETLFFEIHDHIKGDIAELSILLEKMKYFEIPQDMSNQASLLIKKVSTSVKNRMLMLEDKELLEKDFSSGLQMSLLRRYTALNRRFIFEIEKLAETKLAFLSNDFKTAFYSITTEISNNDLKYGFGESFWIIDLLKSNELVLEMKSNSNYKQSKDTNKGHIGISRKVEQFGGILKESIEDGTYSIQIKFTVN